MNKQEVFQMELGWIQNPKIRDFCSALIDYAPDYFWTVSSSSTSKYHPGYALGEGGLVRHSKACAKIMHELHELKMFGKYTQDQKDMMMTAMIAHDFFKHGLPEKAGKYTVATHPTICRDFIRGNKELCAMLPPEQIHFITECIAKHMGSFCTDYRTGKKILPEPETGPENFVHICDMLASRRWLDVDFGDDYYKPTKEEELTEDATELDGIKKQIVDLCKAKIDAGVKQKDLYAIVADSNGGNRNPNSITDVAVATELLHKLEELNV